MQFVRTVTLTVSVVRFDHRQISVWESSPGSIRLSQIYSIWLVVDILNVLIRSDDSSWYQESMHCRGNSPGVALGTSSANLCESPIIGRTTTELEYQLF